MTPASFVSTGRPSYGVVKDGDVIVSGTAGSVGVNAIQWPPRTRHRRLSRGGSA